MLLLTIVLDSDNPVSLSFDEFEGHTIPILF